MLIHEAHCNVTHGQDECPPHCDDPAHISAQPCPSCGSIVAGSVVDRLALVLADEFGFMPANAATMAREWAQLAADRGWPYGLAERAMRECTEAGVSAAGFRYATEPPGGPQPIERLGIALHQPARQRKGRAQRSKRRGRRG